MTNIDCVIDKIKYKQELDITVDEIERVVKDLDIKASGVEKTNTADYGKLIAKLKKENAEAVDFNTRNKLISLKTRMDFIKRSNNSIDNKTTYFDVLEAELVGSNRNIKGFRNSVDARSNAIKAEHTGNVLYQLEEAGLTKLVTSNKFDPKAVAKELYAMDKRKTLGYLKEEHDARASNTKYDVFKGTKVSDDSTAYAIAKILSKEQYRLLTRANRAGSYIKVRPDYIVKQTHHADKLNKAGFDKWYEFIRPLIDEKATLENVDDVDLFFRNIFEDIVYGKVGGTTKAKLKGGIANKLSRDRTIHFKNDEAFMEYNDLYGKKDLMGTFLNSIGTMSRDIAVMEKFGPDSNRNFEKLLDEIDTINRERRIAGDYSPEQLKLIEKQSGEGYKRKLRNYFETVSGAAEIPVLGKLYTAGREIRAVNNLSKLGGAGISATVDAGALPFEASYNGMGFMRSFYEGIKVPVVEPLKALFKNKTRQQQKEIAKLIGVGMEGLTASTMDRFSINDGFAESALMPSNYQRMFFKLNGLNFLTDGFKSAFGRMAAVHLASNNKVAFADMNIRLQNVLGKYDIGDFEWDVIRKTAFEGDDGNMYITPDKIRYVSDNMIKGYISKKFPKHAKTKSLITKVRDDLETSLRSYFVDRADFASPTPGAKERAIMHRGARPGTIWGEVARYFWQYKSFSLTIVTRVWGREIYGGYSKISTIGRGLGLVGLTTTTGMIAASMKEILKGQEPKVFKVAEAVQDGDLIEERKLLFDVLGTGLSQGGGASIYGDLLFSVMGATRYGQSPVEALAGPTAGLVGDVFRGFGVGWSPAMQAAMGDTTALPRIGQTVLRTAGSNLPFGNHPVVRPFKDYFWLQMSEVLNPGYIRKLKRARKRQDMDYYFGPLSD